VRERRGDTHIEIAGTEVIALTLILIERERDTTDHGSTAKGRVGLIGRVRDGMIGIGIGIERARGGREVEAIVEAEREKGM
jgi:hypothetical protein